MYRLLTVITISILLISQNSLNAQSVEEINLKIDSLLVRISSLDNTIDSLTSLKNDLNMELSNYREQVSEIEFENEKNNGIEAKVSAMGGKMRDGPSIQGNIIVELKKDDIVLVYDWYESPYFKVSFDGKIGYLSKSSLIPNDLINSYTEVERQEAIEARRNSNPELARLTDKFGRRVAERIINKEIWIGMTSEMALEARGRPQDVNRSVYSFGVHEQWVYPRGVYLYFEDDILTSWQE